MPADIHAGQSKCSIPIRSLENHLPNAKMQQQQDTLLDSSLP